jgi:predicted nucleic acid-binding protein
MHHAVAVDSNMLTYLHDATSPSFNPDLDPDRDLVAQKLALVRTLFYWDGTLRLVPTVTAEYQRIKESVRRESHDVFAMVLFDEVVDLDDQRVEGLKQHYLKFHSDSDDCGIVAEAELAGTDVLLTYDEGLRRHLNSQLNSLRLMDAQQFWNGLGIPRGAPPHVLPKHGNPLLERTWWVW